MGKPTHEQILNRAHELWKQNGKPDGFIFLRSEAGGYFLGEI